MDDVTITVTHWSAILERTSRYPLLSKVRIEGHWLTDSKEDLI